MLLAREFTVGTLADAKPGSLMLPRSKYEATVLVGRISDAPVAVFLSGQFEFGHFETLGAHNWRGLIVPGVRVEVDETSLFDPRAVDMSLGAIVRVGTELIINAKQDRAFGRASPVTLETGLLATNDLSAGFSKWRVVIGEGHDKRTLVEIDINQAAMDRA